MPQPKFLKIFRPLSEILLLAGGLILLPSPVQAKFDPPRIIQILNIHDTGELADRLLDKRSYYINNGVEVNINRGEVLNVYREKRLAPEIPRPLRIFIGTMTITDAQLGSALGHFKTNKAALAQPLIRYKNPVKNDIVVPRLIIDSEVLFGPGSVELKKEAEVEFEKVALFVKNFSPSKLVIEGHTDSDGATDFNQKLSEDRAKNVKLYLETKYDFITPAMIDAVGYGEERPIFPNDTDINKTFIRRFEVIVWE